MAYTLSMNLSEIRAVKNRIHQLGIQQQREEIKKVSPYSAGITSHIRAYNELRLYCDLRLRESAITRPALVKEIDPSLWISVENCTNLDLMQKGKAPYAFDAPEGRIELHHIGQGCNAPFAELTLEEHNDNSQLLHYARTKSWRTDRVLSAAFDAERSDYWKRRAEMNGLPLQVPFTPLEELHYKNQQEYGAELRETCEELYRQCNTEDLEYLSDLAKSYAMMRRVGASTMNEFLSGIQDSCEKEIQCPVCKSSDHVMSGVYQAQGEKIQRYKCKSCGRVFTRNRKSLISGSSFSFRDWIKFIDCLYNGYTLSQIARACNISERTAHDNRTKLFYALKLLNDKVQLQGNVVIDETYLPVSFKGNHSKQENFVMPRAANKRGGENHAKGITDNLVCIVCAVDDNGNSIAKVAGTGVSNLGKLKYVLKEHLGSDIFCLYSDKSPVIKSFADSCGYEIKQEKLLRKGTKKTANVEFNRDTLVINRYLQVINGYHSRLKKFLNRFAGISTKYLSGYLYLFAWKERTKEQEPIQAYRDLLMILTEPDNFLSVDDIIKNGHLPDAIAINSIYRKQNYTPSERDRAIYAKYAAGQTMTSIAAEYGTTKQNISLIIQKLRKNGFAYKTSQDIQREQVRPIKPQGKIAKSELRKLIRDYQIYAAKQQWSGSAADFEQAMSNKFGISRLRVKNIVSTMKRILKLKDDIFIYENISYRSLEEVYREIYDTYLNMKSEQPSLSDNACMEILAKQYGFTTMNIFRIIQIMTSPASENYFTVKRRLSKTETYNRDKAIFIDFLRWPGERKDFCCYAAKKYGLSYTYVQTILKLCLYADLDRYNMI